MDRAFILAGGQGIRLRPNTLILPKPLLPVGQTPIIVRIIESLKNSSIEEITVSVGYLGVLIEAVLGEGDQFGVRLNYVRESSPRGTAGAVLMCDQINDWHDDDVVLLINGDTLTDLDFAELFRWFGTKNYDAVMVCTKRSSKLDYGVVETTQNEKFLGIVEKPTYEYIVSTGINVFRAKVLKKQAKRKVDMPSLVQDLKSQNLNIGIRMFDGLWMDLGRNEDLIEANKLFDGENLS